MSLSAVGTYFLIASTISAEPNPPDWPANVFVFDESNTSYTQSIVDKVYKENGGTDPALNGQFSNDRYAFLFKPGSHSVNVNIGYYTSLYGTGVSPTDTSIQGVASWDGSTNPSTGALWYVVSTPDLDTFPSNLIVTNHFPISLSSLSICNISLSNFWRSAENFHIPQDMMWSVSQASPLRKAHVDGNLRLSQNGYSSGGYLSDCVVSNSIISGSQQQWFTRNADMKSWNGGSWNMVFVGTPNAPSTNCGKYTNIPSTPIIAEKPYIVIDAKSNKHSLYVPRLEMGKTGSTKDYNAMSDVIDFENVYVSTEDDDADVINAKLESGLAVILTPGNYKLSSSIVINKDNAILMGIGFPVLSPLNGNNVITIGNNVGVKIVGPLLLEGGFKESDTLLQFGDKGGFEGNASNPSFLYDVFARIGGPNDPKKEQQKASTMFTINSDHVIIDGTWLWRADHDVTGGVGNGDNPVNTGLVVNGNNVITYGLAVEHTLQNMVEWKGNNGRCYFYQSEFPYDVTSSYEDNGYTSFKIGDEVEDFVGMGMGAYSFFRDHHVNVHSGMIGPKSANLTNVMSVYLSGNGGIKHIYNDEGQSVQSGTQIKYLCSN